MYWHVLSCALIPAYAIALVSHGFSVKSPCGHLRPRHFFAQSGHVHPPWSHVWARTPACLDIDILYIYIYSCLQFQHPNDMVLGSTCCENTHQNALNASGILDIDMEVSVELKDWKYSFWCVFASTNSGIRHKQQDAACIWQDRRDFVVVPLPDALQSSIIYATYINAVIKPGVCILCLELIWTHQVHNSHCSGPYSKRLEWSSSLCKKNSVSLIPHRWGAGAQRAGMDKQRMRFGSFRRDRSTLPKWHTSPHPPYH